MPFHEHEIAVRAAHDEHDRGDLRLRRRRVALVEPVRVDVPLEMIHADERQARGEREPASVVRADQEAAHQTRPDRRGDRVDLAQLDARGVQRLLRDAVERVQMLARRDLGNDAARIHMRELRGDDVGDDAPAVVDDRDARLVARRLDREDAQLVFF